MSHRRWRSPQASESTEARGYDRGLLLGAEAEQAACAFGGADDQPVAPDEIEQLLRERGYGEITHFGPEEARNTYFGDRDDVHQGGAERILIATVA